MTRISLLASLALVAGCGPHLGKDFGKASRAAFSAQTKRETLAPAGIDEKDAAAVERARAGNATPDDGAKAQPASSYPSSR